MPSFLPVPAGSMNYASAVFVGGFLVSLICRSSQKHVLGSPCLSRNNVSIRYNCSMLTIIRVCSLGTKELSRTTCGPGGSRAPAKLYGHPRSHRTLRVRPVIQTICLSSMHMRHAKHFPRLPRVFLHTLLRILQPGFEACFDRSRKHLNSLLPSRMSIV